MPARPLQREGPPAVGHDAAQADGQPPVRRAVDDRLEVGAGAGGQHGDVFHIFSALRSSATISSFMLKECSAAGKREPCTSAMYSFTAATWVS